MVVGSYYSKTGIYEDSMQNIAGCDSISVLKLTVFSPITSNASGYICGATYTLPSGRVVNSSGVYLDTITSFLGCDSIISLNLSMKYLGTSFQVVYPYLKSNDSVGKNQWLDCNNSFTPIIGDTNRWFTLSSNGSYAVVISNNGCIDTSSCYTINNVGLNENGLLNNTSIYPNPNNGTFNLQFDKEQQLNSLFITDLNGRLIKEITPQKTLNYQVSFEGVSGIYFLNVVSENERRTLKLIKE
jgi:hypothetical protein